jgi:hypothetical protein
MKDRDKVNLAAISMTFLIGSLLLFLLVRLAM